MKALVSMRRALEEQPGQELYARQDGTAHGADRGERRVTRWEHEHLLEAVQRRLDADPGKMRVRRETVEHPFGTIKARMGATHFLMKTMPRVAAEMALHVLAYNLTRVLNIMGVRPLMAAMQGSSRLYSLSPRP